MQPTLVMVPTTQQCQPQSKNFNTVFQQAVLEFAPSSRISSYLLVELSYQLALLTCPADPLDRFYATIHFIKGLLLELPFEIL